MGNPAYSKTSMSSQYALRRREVVRQMGADSALILSAAPKQVVGRDTEQRYLIDPELYYLTGYREPEAVALLVPGADHEFTLFVRPRDPAREQWTGMRGGVEAAISEFGAGAAYPIQELRDRLPGLLEKVNHIHARLAPGSALDAILRRAIINGRKQRARTGRGPGTLSDPGLLLDDRRRIKDDQEISLIRQAAEITVAGFTDALALVRPGAGEWEIEAALEAGFRSRRADGSAFPTIAAGGAHATVLHYTANDRPLEDGDLLLLDAGARFQQYHADLTRTVPVNGRFNPAQRRVYQVVLAAHDAAIARARVGQTIDDLHDAAVAAINAGLRSLGLLTGPDEEAAETIKKYYPHRTCHWLGLEVHDVGGYATDQGSVLLEPGMVFTVEPGLYIPADDTAAAPELRGIGVRIEDDVLITSAGTEVLTAALPTGAEEIEALLAR